MAPFRRDEPGSVHGPTHARETVEYLLVQFPDLEMTIESLVADDKLREHWATRDDLAANLRLGVIHPPGPPRNSG